MEKGRERKERKQADNRGNVCERGRDEIEEQEVSQVARAWEQGEAERRTAKDAFQGEETELRGSLVVCHSLSSRTHSFPTPPALWSADDEQHLRCPLLPRCADEQRSIINSMIMIEYP